MTVAVTGASGHVGANLVRALLARGESVRCLVRKDRRALAGLDVELVEGEVNDREALGRAFVGADVVFHLAAKISIQGSLGGLVERTNIEGARNVAEVALAQGVRRLVHCSSIHAFDQRRSGAPVDERTARALAVSFPAYDRSKAHGERAVREVIARGLDAVIVHPTAVLGPFDFKPSRMGQVLLDLYRRRFVALVPGGFDWVDVRDVVAGMLAAAAQGRRGESYLLSGHYLTVGALAAAAESVTGVAAPRQVVPSWLARFGAPFVLGYNRLRGDEPLYTSESLRALGGNPSISSHKARAELGYDSRPLVETIRDTYAWLEEAGALTAASGAGS
ncbi:MAG: NAD-dependent epimerase/dehydratase family protein [Deltaproteobacteria bacterium]|nr:NAD-dependent epimerase/dehydratase family protein [Deltaproteobacteria bacterium]